MYINGGDIKMDFGKINDLIGFSNKLVRGVMKKFLENEFSRGMITQDVFEILCEHLDEVDIYEIMNK